MFLDPDKSLNVFSSKGNLVQCDNALKAALNGALTIGVACQNGSVLISYKNVSSLVVKEKYHKVFTVCPTIGVTYSGLQPDFRVQLSISQRICQDYFDIYQCFPKLDVFISEFSLHIQEYTQKGGYRPFGTFLIFSGLSKNGPACYQIDPSGSFKMVDYVAAGNSYEQARQFIEKRRESKSCDDNIVNCLKALIEFAGKEIHACDVSMGVFTDKFKVYSEEDIQEVFDSIK
jgi:20S proteasome subunit alpha 2